MLWARSVLSAAVVLVVALFAGAAPASAAPPLCFPSSTDVRVDTVTMLTPNCGLAYGSEDWRTAVFTVTKPPEHGSVRVYRDIYTWFRYLPAEGYRGPDTFSYMLTTSNGTTAEIEQSLNVALDANQLPTCSIIPVPIGAKVRAGASRRFEVQCTDPDGDPTALSVSVQPAHGEASMIPAEAGARRMLEVRPQTGYSGPDTLTLRASDGRGSTDTDVGFTVVSSAGNTAPTCQSTTGGAIKNYHGGVSAVCIDPDGDPVSVRATSPPQHGALTGFRPVTNDLFATHSAMYVPAAGYAGPDSVTLVAEDDRGAESAPVVVALTVSTVPPGSPHCQTLTPAAVQVRAGGSGRIASTCSYFGLHAPEVTDPPQHGRVDIDGGQFVYVPDLGYSGPDSFGYRLLSAGGSGPIVTQPVVVSAGANTAPSCGIDLSGRRSGVPSEPVVRRGDSAAVRATCFDGDGDAVTVTVDDPAHGSALGFVPITSFLETEHPATTTGRQGTYTPDPGYVGFDELTVRGDDGHGGQSSSTMSFAVRHPGFNSPPGCDSIMYPSLVIVSGSEGEYTELCRDAEGDAIALDFIGVPGNLTFGTSRPDGRGGVRTTVLAQDGPIGTAAISMVPVDARGARGGWYGRTIAVIPAQHDVERDLDAGESAGAAIGELPTPARPGQVRVTTLNKGTVRIATRSGSSPAGYGAFGLTFDITAPDAIPEVPLRLRFRFDASIVPAGTDLSTITVFRNGTAVPTCAGEGATPDPCVASRIPHGNGDVEILVLTSKASTWSFGQALGTTPGGGDPGPQVTPSSPASPAERPLVGGGSGTGTATRPPTLRLRSVKLRAALTRGLPVSVTSALAGTARARVVLDGQTAKRLRLSKGKPVTVATGSKAVRPGTAATLTARFTRQARKALGKARTVKLTVRVAVGDGPPATRTVTLKR